MLINRPLQLGEGIKEADRRISHQKDDGPVQYAPDIKPPGNELQDIGIRQKPEPHEDRRDTHAEDIKGHMLLVRHPHVKEYHDHPEKNNDTAKHRRNKLFPL